MKGGREMASVLSVLSACSVQLQVQQFLPEKDQFPEKVVPGSIRMWSGIMI